MNLGLKNVQSRNWAPLIRELQERIDELAGAVDQNPNSVHDLDDIVIVDLDDNVVYENGVTFDNPIASTKFFDTVQEMIDFPTPWEVDRCTTLNYASGDGVVLHWVMCASPTLSDNGDSILASTTSYGYFIRAPQ